MTTATYSSDKNIDRMVKGLLREGWTFEVRRKHNRITSPQGAVILVAKTPSDRRSFLNFSAEIRRAQEKEKQHAESADAH